MAVQSRPFRSFEGNKTQLAAPTKQKRSGMLVVVAIVAALMCILYLAQTGRVATQGYRLEQLDAQEAMLVRQNQQLLFEIEQSQSVNMVRERALALGFVPMKPEQARYLTITIEKTQWSARSQ